MNDTLTLLPVRVYGDVILRQKALPVTTFDDDLKTLVRNMLHTMYERDGVGLAANQVGRAVQVFVLDMDWSKEDACPNPQVLINPEISEGSGEYEMEEGCISVPGVFARVRRFNKIHISYFDEDGKQHQEDVEGYKAVVMQHENDHLQGTLFVDRLGKLALLKVKRKLKAIESTTVNGVNLRTDIYREPDQ